NDSFWPAHYLATITDPLNQRPVQVAYRNTGSNPDKRLDTLTDAAGQVTKMDYNVDPTQSLYVQTIKDPAQKTTTVTFDKRGNVKDVMDQAGQETIAHYLGDSVDMLTQKNPGGQDIVSRFEYDDIDSQTGFSKTGLPARAFDGDNKKTSYIYNNFGQVLSVTDPLNHAVTNTYDPQTGDLLSVQAPATSPTTYRYDGAGNVTATSFGGATT